MKPLKISPFAIALLACWAIWITSTAIVGGPSPIPDKKPYQEWQTAKEQPALESPTAVKGFDDIASIGSTVLTAFATIAIAWFTFALKGATDKLWASADAQRIEMERATKIAQDSAHAANTAADAALASSETALKQFDVSHRPWLPPYIEIKSQITLSVEGLTVDIGIRTKNIGNTPAFSVYAKCECYALVMGADISYEQKRQVALADAFCQDIEDQKRRGIQGITLFPDEVWEMRDTVKATREELLPTISSHQSILPVIHGTIVYRSIVGPVYQSGFIFVISHPLTDDRLPKSGHIFMGLSPGRSVIPMDTLILIPHPAGSGRTT
jgi:hypothetical protein